MPPRPCFSGLRKGCVALQVQPRRLHSSVAKTNLMKTDSAKKIVRRLIQDGGNLAQSLGFGRVLGQIYAFLYFSHEAQNLASMHDALGISKGSASTVVRQLEQWNAVQKVWIKGDRKDYYAANDWLGQILRNAMVDTAARRLGAYSEMLGELEHDIDDLEDGEKVFLKQRVGHLRKFQARAQKVWDNPLVKKMLSS
jgi:DNA-binding transcriptional regulator GbsR (MarR family)